MEICIQVDYAPSSSLLRLEQFSYQENEVYVTLHFGPKKEDRQWKYHEECAQQTF